MVTDGPFASRGSGLSDEPKLVDYHLLPAARADLLARAGLTAEALVALDAAVTRHRPRKTADSWRNAATSWLGTSSEGSRKDQP